MLKTRLKPIIYKSTPKELVDFMKLIKNYIYEKQREKKFLARNKKVIESILKGNIPINIELGESQKRLEGWTTVDLNEGSDICLDLSSLPLPFPDNCIHQIYSSHLLEHLFHREMSELLVECYRILRPKGIIKIAVPNGRIYLEAYFKPEEFNYKEYCLWDTGLSYKSKIDYVNYMAYMGGHHRHMFDEESLLIILADAGFKNVKIRDFDPALDLENRKYESIYAEAEK